MILSPAYGRTYRSRAEVARAFEANQDFIIRDFGHPYEGKPVNKPQLQADGVRKITFRFHNDRKVFNYNLEVA